MKKFLCLLSLFVLFGCSYEDEVKGVQDQEKQISSAGDGQYDLLGYGYDITGEYADPSAGKSLIFDITRIKNYEPFRIEKSLFNKQTADEPRGDCPILRNTCANGYYFRCAIEYIISRYI